MSKALLRHLNKSQLTFEEINDILAKFQERKRRKSSLLTDQELLSTEDLELLGDENSDDLDVDALNEGYSSLKEMVEKHTQLASEDEGDDEEEESEEEESESESESVKNYYNNIENRKQKRVLEKEKEQEEFLNSSTPPDSNLLPQQKEKAPKQRPKWIYICFTILPLIPLLFYYQYQRIQSEIIQVPETSIELSKYLSNQFHLINEDLNFLKSSTENIPKISDELYEQKNSIQKLSNKVDFVEVKQDRKITKLENDIKAFQKKLNNLSERATKNLDDYLKKALPKYIPLIKESGNITISKEHQDYIHSVVESFINNDNVTQISNSEIEKVVENSFEKFFNVKDSEEFSKLIKSSVLENLNSVTFNSNQEDSLITNITGKVVKELIGKIQTSSIKSNLEGENDNNGILLNYASYENGARIIPELVSSFESFNITKIYNLQKAYYNKISSKLRKKFVDLKDPIKHCDESLILNTYQTILPGGIPRDNFPNLAKIKTGLKTFAIKLPQTIYLDELIISYPRRIRSPSMIFSAPKKISVWIQLAHPDKDLAKLHKYLYEATKSELESKYVLDTEKLSNNNKEIPMKRLKSEDEVIYENFYESNFQLFDNNYVKIGSMEYEYLKDSSIRQRFPLINKHFKKLRFGVESIFFAIESNYGNDSYVTNLFNVEVFGASELDVYCLKALVGGKKNQSNWEELEKDFLDRYVKNNQENDGLDEEFYDDDQVNKNRENNPNNERRSHSDRIIISDNDVDYF